MLHLIYIQVSNLLININVYVEKVRESVFLFLFTYKKFCMFGNTLRSDFRCFVKVMNAA